MKDRERLVGDIISELEDKDPYVVVPVAVDGTTYAVLEYIDDLIEQFKHYSVMTQVLKTLRSNVAQFSSRS